MINLFGRFQFPEKDKAKRKVVVQSKTTKSVSDIFQNRQQPETSSFPILVENTTECLFADAISSISGALKLSRRSLAIL